MRYSWSLGFFFDGEVGEMGDARNIYLRSWYASFEVGVINKRDLDLMFAGTCKRASGKQLKNIRQAGKDGKEGD